MSQRITTDDPTTLFICAGMQPLKNKFQFPDGSGYGNIQDCVRTNDIDEVGDGTHLTYFQMIGSFGFGTNNYPMHVELWSSIMRDLGIRVDTVHIHPDSPHKPLWHDYTIVDDPSCVWSDGNVGGYCCEMYNENLEIGNLVNPMGHSVDVGFGLERLYQIMGGFSRVDETDLFRQDLDPVSRDHCRVLEVFYREGILPGTKGRNYQCRKILRRFIRLNPGPVTCLFSPWIEPERKKFKESMKQGRNFYKKNPDAPLSYWWDTYGILDEEIPK